jgi:hypothetical protein
MTKRHYFLLSSVAAATVGVWWNAKRGKTSVPRQSETVRGVVIYRNTPICFSQD